MTWGPSPGDWTYRWAGPSQWFQLTEDGGSPAAIKGCQGWAVRRWTSNYGGPVHIVCRAERNDKKGDGVEIKVFLDGRQLATRTLAPGSAAELELSPGITERSHLDFAVTPGPALDSNNDATNFHIVILTSP